MTQYIGSSEPTTANLTTTKFGSDAEMPAPFQALDRLSKVGQQIDALLSTLIGQLQPYCSEAQNVPGERLADPPKAIASPLEQRIDREIALLQEVVTRGEELLGRLRL